LGAQCRFNDTFVGIATDFAGEAEMTYLEKGGALYHAAIHQCQAAAELFQSVCSRCNTGFKFTYTSLIDATDSSSHI
jgi:hypothetical protein